MVRPRALSPLAALAAAMMAGHVAAVMPTAFIRMTSSAGGVFAAPADFGGDMPRASRPLGLQVFVPEGAADGCDLVLPEGVSAEQSQAEGYDGFAVLSSRGNCSFETKALSAQKLGASAVVIYNSLEGVWSNRSAVEPKWDYECANGQAWIATVTPPVWSVSNEVDECTQDARCKSHRCLVTNNTDATQGTQTCCAWDLYITMGGDATAAEQPTIPAVFITMADSDILVTAAYEAKLLQKKLTIELSERGRPFINISSFLIWVMGVSTVIIAAWNSARSMRKRDAKARLPAEHAGRGGEGDEEEEEDEGEVAVDLSVGHTVGFIVMASCFLILLFYVNLNAVINVLYSFSAGSAVASMTMRPILKKFVLPRRLANAVLIRTDRIGLSLSVLDVLSTTMGLGLACWWYLVRGSASYAWVLQDIMGISLCILFLSLVRFPNIRVATVLLCLAFFYDIFFVFLSPIFFKESVMVKVATGGTPKADATYCEKYPSDRDCQTREELPMLLVLPRINDYQGGYTMLGLGDIILPGLLVAFAARYDHSVGVPLTRGYFRLMVWGYAVGLMMANLAVYLMEMGQPALLYLVPCTLGVFSLVSFREGTLRHMWDGPPSLNPHYRQKTPRRAATPGLTLGVSDGAGGAAAGTIVGAPLSVLPPATTEEEPLLDA